MTTFVTRVQTRIFLAAALSATAFAAPVHAQEGNGTSFIENFDSMDRSFWYVSDGWNNGSHQNCTWSNLDDEGGKKPKWGGWIHDQNTIMGLQQHIYIAIAPGQDSTSYTIHMDSCQDLVGFHCDRRCPDEG